MKLLTFALAMCVMCHTSMAGDDKQIKLEDIERDTLIGETERTDEPEQKELAQQPTQHIQLSYSNNPQDIFVTPMPGRYASNALPADLRSQLYHLPKVHEAEQTYTVPAKQTLLQPIIGGSQPIQPVLAPQPQYIYIQSPQSHQTYMPQAHAYVMVPYSSQYNPQQSSIHMQQQHHQHHAVLSQPEMPTPVPTVYTYSHGPSSAHHQPSYQSAKSLEYNIPATAVTPLQTSVDYKSNMPITIVPKKTLPSISTTSFQQYYSPGLEYHYSEALPYTKLSPQSSYSYQNAPTHSYHTNYVPQTPSYSYYQSGTSSLAPSYNKHQSSGLLESYVPSMMTYARQQQQHQQQHQQQYQQQQHQYQQQNQYKNYYPTQFQQSISSSHHYPQQLFTPSQASQPSSYSAYPSSQAYNTIQYSVSLPPYEHSKRSTSKATATLSVQAPKST